MSIAAEQGHPVEVHLVSAELPPAEHREVNSIDLCRLPAGGWRQLRMPEKRTAAPILEQEELTQGPMHLPPLEQPAQVPAEGIVPHHRSPCIRIQVDAVLRVAGDDAVHVLAVPG